MKRIALTDGNGSWFDSEKAEIFKENTFHNGSNWISKATGSQWEHECLYRTSGGKFILNHYSNVQGTVETYFEVDNETAAAWLVRNGYSDEDIPGELSKEVTEMEIQ